MLGIVLSAPHQCGCVVSFLVKFYHLEESRRSRTSAGCIGGRQAECACVSVCARVHVGQREESFLSTCAHLTAF